MGNLRNSRNHFRQIMCPEVYPVYPRHLRTVKLYCLTLFQTIVVAHLRCKVTLLRAMAPKPSLPLYHHKERAKFSRRKNGSYIRRRSGGLECLWILGIICPVLLVGIGLGVLIGIEMTLNSPNGPKGEGEYWMSTRDMDLLG